MNPYNRPFAVALPTLTPEWVRVWMEKTQDLVLLLDDQDCIAGLFQGGAFATDDLYHWMGQDLVAIVSTDSSSKLPGLLANDAALDHQDARWRHINLLGVRNQIVPVLAKCMSLPAEGVAKAVFCRDLRPLQEANNRFMALQQELEHSNQSLRGRLQAQAGLRPLPKVPDTGAMVQMIKQSTYAQVIQETVTILERQCLQALLDEAGGDHVRAAWMAGLSLAEWQEKLALFRMG